MFSPLFTVMIVPITRFDPIQKMAGYKPGQKLTSKVSLTFCKQTADTLLQKSIIFCFVEGQEITLHYAGGLKGRLLRRTLLAEGWFFLCQCKRFVQ